MTHVRSARTHPTLKTWTPHLRRESFRDCRECGPMNNALPPLRTVATSIITKVAQRLRFGRRTIRRRPTGCCQLCYQLRGRDPHVQSCNPYTKSNGGSKIFGSPGQSSGIWCAQSGQSTTLKARIHVTATGMHSAGTGGFVFLLRIMR